MTAVSPKVTLGAGAVAGLLLSALIVAVVAPSFDADNAPSRPDSVPAEAVWQADLFGYPGWLHCAPAQASVGCTAYSARGVSVLTVNYVAWDAKAALPAHPFEHIITPDVEQIWINKVALVPDGTAEFPAERRSIEFRRGKRQGDG